MIKIINFATLLLVMVMLACLNVFATQTPFSPAEDARFRTIETGSAIQSKTFTFDVPAEVALISGSSALGAFNLDVTLPKNALITDGWIYIVTKFVNSAAIATEGTIALHCEDAGNLMSASGLSTLSVGGISGLRGAAVEADNGRSTTNFFGAIGSECSIIATVASNGFTVGKFNGWIEFVVHE